ncbi:hypothetical protein [Actinoalloteichus hymeniacidonis]|uniref:Uncharacterized protein n=1 Tax=Actinoalloteichus hymeniacidonis TaxID=340345 RepID=A0AAC9MXB8_9PSEU|nr:hypothetical protein [Actinoalloteichus hymeniacidonis]AOS63058.1 hypothetical protein TL08_11220 [Actinoalloteichus hymeniacidonis]MBB5908907.1 hypothetical protein [Actinoalloteichus hymeniacidonis]
MTALPVFVVRVSREDNLWVAVVDGLPGGATDTIRLDDIELETRDLIAGLTDREPSGFQLEWRFEQDGHDLTPMLSALRWREVEAATAAGLRDEARRVAIGALRGARLSLRAVAELMGISHQRVQQLTDERVVDQDGRSASPSTSRTTTGVPGPAWSTGA